MTDVLFPSFEIPDEVADIDDDTSLYGTAWRWDWERSDFRTVGGAPEIAPGHIAWIEWCLKALRTERGVYLIYSDDYGIDFQAIKQARTREEAEAVIADEIRDCLTVDPRTASVGEFGFSWRGDAVLVAFVAEPTVGTTERLEVILDALA